MFVGDLGAGVIGVLPIGEATKEAASSLSRDAPADVGVGGDDSAGGKALRWCSSRLAAKRVADKLANPVKFFFDTQVERQRENTKKKYNKIMI